MASLGAAYARRNGMRHVLSATGVWWCGSLFRIREAMALVDGEQAGWLLGSFCRPAIHGTASEMPCAQVLFNANRHLDIVLILLGFTYPGVRGLAAAAKPFVYQDLFQHDPARKVDTKFRKLTSDYVSTVNVNGKEFLQVRAICLCTQFRGKVFDMQRWPRIAHG